MRRTSGRVSLASRRIWGDPEDEAELSSIACAEPNQVSVLGETPNVAERTECEKTYINGSKPSVKGFTVPSTTKGKEASILRTKKNVPKDERHIVFSTTVKYPEEHPKLMLPLTVTLPIRSIDKIQGINGAESQYSLLPTNDRSQSSNDASDQESKPTASTKLTGDQREATQNLQELYEPSEISPRSSRETEEVKKEILELATKSDNKSLAPCTSSSQENPINSKFSTLNETLTEDVVVDKGDKIDTCASRTEHNSACLDTESNCAEPCENNLCLNEEFGTPVHDRQTQFSVNLNELDSENRKISDNHDRESIKSLVEAEAYDSAVTEVSTNIVSERRATEIIDELKSFDNTKLANTDHLTKNLSETGSTPLELLSFNTQEDINQIEKLPEEKNSFAQDIITDLAVSSNETSDINCLVSESKANNLIISQVAESTSTTDTVDFVSGVIAESLTSVSELDITSDDNEKIEIAEAYINKRHSINENFVLASGGYDDTDASRSKSKDLKSELKSYDSTYLNKRNNTGDCSNGENLEVNPPLPENKIILENENINSSTNTLEPLNATTTCCSNDLLDQDESKFNITKIHAKTLENDSIECIEHIQKNIKDTFTSSNFIGDNTVGDLVDNVQKAPDDEIKVKIDIEEANRPQKINSAENKSSNFEENQSNIRVQVSGTDELDKVDKNQSKKKKLAEVYTIVPRNYCTVDENQEETAKSTNQSQVENKRTLNHGEIGTKYIENFERASEEGSINPGRLSSMKGTLRLKKRGNTQSTIHAPQSPEIPKKNYAPSNSGSTTPDKRRKSLRKKIKEKITDKLHKHKDSS